MNCAPDFELPFADRAAAGRALAVRVAALAPVRPVVLALPRGGVPVAFEVARALGAPLDLLLVRKIGVPYQPELALAAVMDGEAPVLVIDEPVQRATGIDRATIESLARAQRAEIERRRRLYLGARPAVPLAGATAIVVDDGIATGTTVRAALKGLRGLRQRAPARIVLAVPVAPPSALAELRHEVDDLVCLAQPAVFDAIGCFYRDFHQLSDAEVIELMARSTPPPQPPPAP
ncbi:MAG: phosphoribosyltransferase [Burkholderiaceae bacterium]|jgi:putative phosphoribosyl transferase